MDIQTILSHVEHTNLERTVTFEDIKNLCDDSIKYGCASVCVPPCFVNGASEYINGKIKLATVVGFPNGYSETYIKINETSFAVLDGANEINLSLNLAHVKDKRFDLIANEIKAVKKACEESALKVIIETSLITIEETVKLCDVAIKNGADYIVTASGCGVEPSSASDVEFILKHVGDNIKVQAVCNIEKMEDAQALIELGAAKIGASNMIKLMKA